MDDRHIPTDASEAQRQARRKLAVRRRRHAGLRRRAVSLSLMLFALTWVAVFGQMAVGHDPVLGSGSKSGGGSASSSAKSQSSASSQQEPTQTASSPTPTYYVDPSTGEIYAVPGSSSSASSAPPQQTSAPAPVVTSSS